MKNSILIFFILVGALQYSAAGPIIPPCPTILVTGTNTTCYEQSTGTATAQIITGGSGYYTYSWSNGVIASGSSSTITNLNSGTYTVTVMDNTSGCTVVGAYVVKEPDPITITGTVSNIKCFGDATGGVNVNVVGGVTPYSYDWTNNLGNNVSNVEDLTGVVSGEYTLTVNAPNSSCSASQVFTIDEPTEALNSSVIKTNVDCFGNSSGRLDVSVWGGTSPYAYSWDSGSSTQDITGLPSGSYALTITDNKGCTHEETYNITQPNTLSGTMSKVDILCHGDATGSVGITPNGGTSPYNYSWQNSQSVLAANTPTLNNVVAENYQVTITDAHGCTYTSSKVISEPDLLTLNAIVTNVNCYGGSDGAIDLSVSGGIGPYNYVWKNSVLNTVGNSQDLSGIPAEVYNVKVTDNNGCVATLTEAVLQPLSPIAVNVAVTPVLCKGENTGAVSLSVNGGTPGYTYSWSSGQTTKDLQNLLASTYSYTVIDVNGCTNTANVVISEPSNPLSVTNTITNVNCYGETNGAINLTVSGGTPDYSYKWSNSSYQLSITTEDISGYGADNYRYVIADANGCKISDTLTITQPPLLSSTIVGTDILCKGDNTGAIDLTVMGGVLPYTFAWNNGLITEDLVNLEAGIYDVIVTDAHGCEVPNNIELTEPDDSLLFTFDVKDVKCNDGTDGEIQVNITGGTTLYSINWSNGDTTHLIKNLVAGVYGFEVTDAHGCVIGDTITVSQPDPVTLNETITDVSCYGLSDGIIDITPVGGTYPYNFTWYNSDYALSAQTEDLVDFPAETYQLEILDSNNCFYDMFLEIQQPDSIAIKYTFNQVSCNEGNDASIDVQVTGGTPAYNYSWSNGETTEDLNDIPAGVYSLNLEDQNGCLDSIEVHITQPEPLSLSFKTTDVTCKDQFDGTAYAQASGGSGGYQYYWGNGTNDAYTEQLTNDYHSVEVTDILGCDFTDSVYVGINPIGCINPVNTFTPNEDFYNDTWIIDNMELYPDLQMQIFNKWGKSVYKTEREYKPWDGKFNGIPLPAGVYYWILNLNNNDNDIFKGTITIIR